MVGRIKEVYSKVVLWVKITLFKCASIYKKLLNLALAIFKTAESIAKRICLFLILNLENFCMWVTPGLRRVRVFLAQYLTRLLDFTLLNYAHILCVFDAAIFEFRIYAHISGDRYSAWLKAVPTRAKKVRSYLPYLSIIAVLLGFFALFHRYIYLASDDFYYATYFKDGFSSFLNLTKTHYASFNGRAFVHFALQLCLINYKSFIVLNPLFLFGSFAFFACTIFERTRPRLVFIIIALSSVFTLSAPLLKESLFWISGSFNYLFPFFVFSSLVYFVKRSMLRGTLNPYILLLAFLCGATTEQMGLCAVFLGFVVFCHTVYTKGKFKYCLLLPASLFGYLSVLLAGGTATRIGSHSLMSLLFSGEYWGNIPKIAPFLTGEYGIPAILLCVFIIITFLSLRGKNTSKYAVIAAMPIFSLVPLLFGKDNLEVLTFVAFYSIVYTFLCLIVVFSLDKRHSHAAFLICCAFILEGIMILPGEFSLRTTLPSILFIICTLAYFLTVLLDSLMPHKWQLFILFTASFACMCVFEPIYDGYQKNHIIHMKNEQTAQLSTSDTVYYNTDIDEQYYHLSLLTNPNAYNGFKKYYDINDKQLVLDTPNSPMVFFNGKPMAYPAIMSHSVAFLDLGEISTHLGADFTLHKKSPKVVWHGETYNFGLGAHVMVRKPFRDSYVNTYAEPADYSLFPRIFVGVDVLSDIFRVDIAIGEDQVFVTTKTKK